MQVALDTSVVIPQSWASSLECGMALTPRHPTTLVSLTAVTSTNHSYHACIQCRLDLLLSRVRSNSDDWYMTSQFALLFKLSNHLRARQAVHLHHTSVLLVFRHALHTTGISWSIKTTPNSSLLPLPSTQYVDCLIFSRASPP